MRAGALAFGLALLGLPAVAGGQSLAQRVEGIENGVARMAYATRPDVEICDQGIRMGGHHMWWRFRGRDEGPTNCRMGEVEVELRVRDGSVRDVEVIRRERDRRSDAVDLGRVGAGEAASYLLDLARDGRGRGDDGTIFPAMLADVDGLWRDLMDIARDTDVRQGVRKDALFWIGQEAADAATEGLADVAFDEDEEQEVRDAAVFALSQRPDDEGVPVLMELAMTAREAKTRRSAMFWLAQSEDARVIAFFEDVLLGRGGA